MIADGIQKKLQQLVDVKDEIKQDLWTLASGCNENLKKKIAKFPESARQSKEEVAKKELGAKRNVTQAALS